MQTFSADRCEKIALRIKEKTERWGARVYVRTSNFDYTLNIFVERADGATMGWIAGVINAPINPNETDNWKPKTKPVPPAVKAAIEFASPV